MLRTAARPRPVLLSMSPRPPMSLAAGGAFFAALVVTLAVADHETAREARQAPHPATRRAPAARPLALRALPVPAGRTVRDRKHALRVALPPGWRRSHLTLTPRMAEGGTILTVATFDPGARIRLGCGWPPDLPQTPIGSRDALLHVEEQLGVRPWHLPRRPRRFELWKQLRRPGVDERVRSVFPWRSLNRPGIVGFWTTFRPHGRLLHVTAVAGEHTGRRLRSKLLGIAESLRVGPTPPVRVGVHPPVGRPWTRFRLELVSSGRTGRHGRRERAYSAAVRGPLRTACVIETGTWFTHGPPGSRLHAVLDPSRAKGGRWCRGSFRGVVRYRDGLCRRPGRCFHMHVSRAGSFSFSVR
jgi:hypothetical protein